MFAAGIGPVLLGIGGAINLAIRMHNAIGMLAQGFRNIKGAFSAGGKAIAFFTSPIGITVLAIGALIAIGILLWKNWDRITEWFSERFPNAFARITDTINWVRGFISDNMEHFKGIFQGFTDFIGGIFSGDLDRAFGGLGMIVDNLANIFRNLIAPLEERFPAVFGFLSGIIDNFQETIHRVLGNIKGIFNGFRDFFTGVFTGDWELALNGLGEIFRNSIGLVVNIAQGAFNNIFGFFELLISPLQERFPLLFGIISDHIGIFRDTVTDIFSGIKQVFGGIVDFVVGIFTGDWERAWYGVVNIFGGIFSMISALVKAPINGIISIVNRAIGGINNISVDIPDWVPLVGGRNFGVNLPKIPMLATGTDFHRGGPAIVGEEGPELVNLPRGSQVIPNDETNRILAGRWNDNNEMKLAAAIKGIAPREIPNADNQVHSKTTSTLGRKNRPKTADSYNIDRYDTASAGNTKQAASFFPPEINVIIQSIEIAGDGNVSEGTLAQLVERLKQSFKEVFGELWEEAWYNLSLKYPNITET